MKRTVCPPRRLSASEREGTGRAQPLLARGATWATRLPLHSAAAGGPKPRPGIPGAADGAGDDENTEGENEDAESALSPEPSPEREDQ